MIGAVAKRGRARSDRHTVKPSISGIMMSSRIQTGLSALRLFQRLLAVESKLQLIAAVVQQRGDQLAHRGQIIYDQNGAGGRHVSYPIDKVDTNSGHNGNYCRADRKWCQARRVRPRNRGPSLGGKPRPEYNSRAACASQSAAWAPITSNKLPTTMTERIGFIGLGIMGSGMAMNVLRAGFPSTVWELHLRQNHAVGRGRRGRGQHAGPSWPQPATSLSSASATPPMWRL